MPHFIGPDSQMFIGLWNFSIVSWPDIERKARQDPGCVTIDEVVYERAVEAYVRQTGRKFALDATTPNLRYSRLNGEDGFIAPRIIRSGKLVELRSLNQVLEKDDVVLLEYLIC